MNENSWLYDNGGYSKQHINDLHREAAQDRLANQLPQSEGVLAKVLHRIATVIQTI